MKKFLSILAAVGLTATTSTAVVACATESKTATVDATAKTATLKLDAKEAKKLGLIKDAPKTSADGDNTGAGDGKDKPTTPPAGDGGSTGTPITAKYVAGDNTKAVADKIGDATITVTGFDKFDANTGEVTLTFTATAEVKKGKKIKVTFSKQDDSNKKTLDAKLDKDLPATGTPEAPKA
ncbi:lipoprotein [Mesoplasma lactucae]|uniref:Uncharacterized protein n=1 Tax=Mesoplasma lactucae ATCC 49193 TaxID=81460 RepID=A0A291IRE3_9MOLU|nr:lipoprotein [Mesoplasma lactucae]ATG97296.1 hypothetical protein CP520_00790 [Mesoplasma lactucae ATCC 49193]ATZ20254.1 hypothetical protein MLACT_v1c04330 [Mesoplasma lactucae ATCC 49193]MCL8216425.1 hypothetical protein [Mesoplasma lactucae ATCC 49193]